MNLHGIEPTMGSSPRAPVHSKRSYIRACRRALQLGATWYKGSCLTSQMVPAYMKHKLQECHTPSATHGDTNHMQANRPHVPKRRLNILHWNASNLSKERYLEIVAWTHQLHLDVIILSQTHWGLDTEWPTEHYWVIHSGTFADKSNGLMILVSKRFCPDRHLSWYPIIDGRLVHIRVHGARFHSSH